MNKFLIVKKYIDEYDFYDLLKMNAPSNEYDLESRLISEQISKDSSVEEIGYVIQSVFSNTFASVDKFNINECLEIATKIKNEF